MRIGIAMREISNYVSSAEEKAAKEKCAFCDRNELNWRWKDAEKYTAMFKYEISFEKVYKVLWNMWHKNCGYLKKMESCAERGIL